MIERIEAAPAQVRQIRGRMADLATEIGDVRHRLESTLAGEGRCWGTDEAGVAFEIAYGAVSQAVRSMLATVEDAVDEIAARLGVVAAVLETAEHDARRVVA